MLWPGPGPDGGVGAGMKGTCRWGWGSSSPRRFSALCGHCQRQGVAGTGFGGSIEVLARSQCVPGSPQACLSGAVEGGGVARAHKQEGSSPQLPPHPKQHFPCPCPDVGLAELASSRSPRPELAGCPALCRQERTRRCPATGRCCSLPAASAA
ncbi:hypothetical protein KIL84_021674 [Mauremys mutica]|uniref:Uncharacterized protein n=1 Tax=Mauremys mutica TaxID=74926 RepID=A0A9D4B058_9SAUR|nr:hypothetical protein KIL84_021674 [Mauremys mutica]